LKQDKTSRKHTAVADASCQVR